MKIILRNHSPTTKVSDLLMVVFSVAYFIAGLCFAKDLFACAIFLLSVLCIIIIKYLKLSENENDEKAIIAGAGALLAYFLVEKNKEKKTDISEVSIFPREFYEK